MPFDHNNSADLAPPRLRPAAKSAPLSAQLAHFALLKLVRFIRRGNDLIYTRTSGLSDFEWRVLTRVCDTPGMSINEIGELMDRSVAQVSRTVRRLVELGLVRRQNVGGGPGVAISPTTRGEEVYAPLIAVALSSERELTQGLTDAELQTLDRIIEVMTQNAMRRVAREQLQSRDGED